MIDRDVPPPKFVADKMPRPQQKRERPLPRSVLASMQVNDSVLIKGEPRVYQNARTAAATYGKQNDMQFVSRAEGDGLRIWRVA